VLNVARLGTTRQTFKQIAWGGITYDICIKQFASGLKRAEWRCSECDEDGSWAPVSADANEALKLAKVCIGVHHSLLHRGQSGNVSGNGRD
jgi:hypothetical protein